MTDPNLINFVWNAVVGGIAGNAAYDGIKAILGKGFDRLASYAEGNKEHEFEIALQAILETNEKIEQQLFQLHEGLISNVQQQNHYGVGDNIGRDKVININPVAPSLESVKYNLTDKQKDALKSLVEMGRRKGREEFEIVWFTGARRNMFPDIHMDHPPQISKGEILALREAKVLILNFLSDDRALITLTKKSYEAVDTNFQETV